jgi:HK97 family phage major capsid protein
METRYREFVIDASRANEEERTVEASLSSEEPVPTWRGMEVLSHDAAAVDMVRAKQGLPLLESHDARGQIGIIEGVHIQNKKLRGTLRFGTTARAQELWGDVKSGIRRAMSIGFRELAPARVIGERDGEPVVLIDRWQPVEASLVSVALDHTVGIGRGRQFQTLSRGTVMDEGQDTTGARERVLIQGDAVKERERTMNILAIGERFGLQTEARAAIESGTSVANFNRAVLEKIDNTGRSPSAQQPLPPSHDTRVESVRHSGQLRGFKTREDAYAAGQFILGAIYKNQPALRWCQGNRQHFGGMDVRAASEGVNTTGGATVPEILSDSIVMNIEEHGAFRPNARVLPMTSDTLKVPVRAGGLQAVFISENEEAAEQDVTWTNVALSVKKVMCLSRLSSEVMEDAVIDLAQHVSLEIGLAFALIEDRCGFVGDGTSTYGGMRGVAWKIEQDSSLAGYVLAATNNDQFSEITGADLAKLMGTLPAYAVPGAKFYCSQQGFSGVFERLVSASGGNTLETLAMPARRQFLGYPIVVSQVLPTTTGDLSNKVMLLFGDLTRAAIFGDRRQIRIIVSEHRYLELDQIGVVGTQRFDINVHDVGTDAVAGPVVALVGN